jgi:probable phosphoglycerate mutase
MTLALAQGLTLYFARHGQTEANAEHRFSGVKDTPLTDLGRRQARQVGEILLDTLGLQPTVDFVSSPLQRAKTTMGIVREVLGLPHAGFRTDPRLIEIDLGIWDQLTDEEAKALDPDFFARRVADKWNVRIPEGENYADVAARVESFVNHLARDTFVVSHGATTRILRGLFAGLGVAEMSALDEPQGVVFCARENQVVRLDP